MNQYGHQDTIQFLDYHKTAAENNYIPQML